jgi:hypothetical protein
MLCRLALIFALSIGYACAQAPIPNTPAGQTLHAWFDAFNSADRARVEAFIQKFQPSASVDRLMDFRDRTGRLELVAINKIERTHIEFQVKQTANSKTAIGELYLKDASPAQVVKLNFIGLEVLSSEEREKQ